MSPKESVKNDRVVEVIKCGVESHGVRGLAREVGISPAIITRYMQGKVGEPSQATLEKVSRYAQVPVAWLRGGLNLNYDEIDEMMSAGGLTSLNLEKMHQITELVTEALGRDGLSLPVESNEKRRNYINILKNIVEEVSLSYTLHLIKWELLSINEIEDLIKRLQEIKVSKLSEIIASDQQQPE